jgi:hypothetical protein
MVIICKVFTVNDSTIRFNPANQVDSRFIYHVIYVEMVTICTTFLTVIILHLAYKCVYGVQFILGI